LSLPLLTSCGPAPSVSQGGITQFCTSFDEYPVGTRFDVGDRITSPVVDVSFEQGNWPAGGYARIDDRGYAKGYCNDLQVNNTNIVATPQYPTSSIALRFAELGGRVALGVNGPPSEAQDLVDFSGVSVGGTQVTIAATKEGNNWYGVLQVTGPIHDLTLGGQELWLDDVCLSIGSTDRPLHVLFDARSGAGQSNAGLWPEYKSELMARGYSISYHTSGEITPSELTQCNVYVIIAYQYQYTAAEKQALSDFVNAGGGLLVSSESWGLPFEAARDLLDAFGATPEQNMVVDPTNHEFEEFWVVYDAQTHFITKCHPVVKGVSKIRLDAAATFTGPGWDALVNTDDDATPPNRSVVMGKAIGQGRMIAIGDQSVFAASGLPVHDNKRFVLQLMDWLCFRI
jgi:hypothetical protein